MFTASAFAEKKDIELYYKAKDFVQIVLKRVVKRVVDS